MKICIINISEEKIDRDEVTEIIDQIENLGHKAIYFQIKKNSIPPEKDKKIFQEAEIVLILGPFPRAKMLAESGTIIYSKKMFSSPEELLKFLNENYRYSPGRCCQ